MRFYVRALIVILMGFSLQAVANADQQNSSGIPLVLEKFLRQNPAYHLLKSSDISNDYLRKSFSEGDLFPFQLADTAHSGKKDVVAVLVKERRFSVLVLQEGNGGYSEAQYWLVRDSANEIAGAIINGDYIVPAYCYGCENPETYAWTGSSYGKNVVLPGQFVCLSYDTAIYSKPDERLSAIIKTQEPVGADVLSIGKPQGELYWHKVKLRNKQGLIGFVLNNNFSDYDCADLKD